MGKKQEPVVTVQFILPQQKLEVNITAIFSGPELEVLQTKFKEVGVGNGIKEAIKGFFETLTGSPTQVQLWMNKIR